MTAAMLNRSPADCSTRGAVFGQGLKQTAAIISQRVVGAIDAPPAPDKPSTGEKTEMVRYEAQLALDDLAQVIDTELVALGQSPRELQPSRVSQSLGLVREADRAVEGRSLSAQPEHHGALEGKQPLPLFASHSNDCTDTPTPVSEPGKPEVCRR